MTRSSSSSVLLQCLLILSSTLHVHARVVLTFPTPRTDQDDLKSLDPTVCNFQAGVGCDSFCGTTYDASSYSVTNLPVGEPITLTWDVNRAYVPFLYRFSLNPTAADVNFDSVDNILLVIDNEVAADPSNDPLANNTGSFSHDVIIPRDFLDTCSLDAGHDPCVLQLFDMFYHVSCANVLLTGSNTSAPTGSTPPPTSAPSLSPVTFTPTWSSQAPTQALPARTADSIAVQNSPNSGKTYMIYEGLSTTGNDDPTLYLTRCQQYTFLVNTPGQPFVLKNDVDGFGTIEVLTGSNGGVTGTGLPSASGMEYGTFTFTAGANAPDRSLFYTTASSTAVLVNIAIVDETGLTC